ncbi:MAG: hypothetical protein BWX84_01199 [Verrucomicrobia bacterium ADurb.Bin118]|nr:MAG: hypothetical protein BWX84_01199 [Verrucomicrobia bacterium ADurb.Bin118]
MASTRSPTSSLSLSVMVIAGKFLAFTFKTAMSVCASLPTTLAV